MAKILLINPNKWGRGITQIWIASHLGILKRNDHEVELFHSKFYSSWSLNEVQFQTKNQMYKKTNYDDFLKFNKNNIYEDLQKKIDKFNPDFIFWSAISSHIHGEGEYVNVQNGYDLLKNLDTKNAILLTGGLQATSAIEIILKKMEKIDFLIEGESELVLLEILNNFDDQKKLKNTPVNLEKINGVSYIKDKKFVQNKKQKIIGDLDKQTSYDYDIFDKQVLIRSYNGAVVKAVDYEMSRGCIYSLKSFYDQNQKNI